MRLADQEQWIPPSDEVLASAPNAYGDFRHTLDARLEDIPHPDEYIGLRPLRIGQTLSVLGIPDTMIGYINPSSTIAVEDPTCRFANKAHINAPWLYGGDTWPIRTETLSTDAERSYHPGLLRPKAIVVTFADVA